MPPLRGHHQLSTISHTRVDDIEATVYDFLERHDTKPKPFYWSNTAEDILVREQRALD
jgi:hypothetical protein